MGRLSPKWRGTVSVHRMRDDSAAAERVHDFDAVAFVQHEPAVLAAWHDFAIDLDRDAAAGQAFGFEQGRQRGVGGGKGAGRAVEQDVHAADCRMCPDGPRRMPQCSVNAVRASGTMRHRPVHSMPPV